MICILQRSFLICPFGSFRMSWPTNSTLPSLAFVRPRTALPVEVFPLPLSPAKHITSPLRTSKETSSTARTHSSFLVKMPVTPLRAGNQTDRFSTLSRACSCVRLSLPEVFRESSRCNGMQRNVQFLLVDIQDLARDRYHPAMGIADETCSQLVERLDLVDLPVWS